MYNRAMGWQFDSKGAYATVKTAGQRVYKKGKIFQCGDYPDKGVTISPEELAAANRDFAPVPINIEHGHSLLDGRLGELIKVDVADDGAVFGLLSIPEALDELLSDDPEIPVSIEIDSGTKEIVGLALTKFPRVRDAAVFAKLGVQQQQGRKPHTMSIKELLKSAFSRAVDELPDDAAVDVAPTAPAVPAADVEARIAAEREAREAAERELAEIKAAHEKAEAERNEAALAAAGAQFAAECVRDRRILPAQADALALQYTAAVRADNKGVARFSEGAPVEGEAAKALRSMIAQMPQHRLTADFMGGRQLKAVPGDGDRAPDAARRHELMTKSSLGRVAAKNTGAN